MENTALGGGIMLAIAAVLWLAYLVPSWFKRTEYLATERNAVRLQQTIRVLAETSELPEVVRAGMKPQVHAPQPVPQPSPGLDRRVRLRRGRLVATTMLLASLAAVGVQVALMASTGIAAGSWLVLGLGMLGSLTALALLSRLAEAGRATAAPAQQRVARPAQPIMDAELPAQAAAPWTPVPLPKPLYLSRSAVEEAAARPDPVTELQAAAVAAETALRAAQREATPIRGAEPIATRPAAVAPSRFAAMGLVDDATSSGPDLDDVLRRRRAAG